MRHLNTDFHLRCDDCPFQTTIVARMEHHVADHHQEECYYRECEEEGCEYATVCVPVLRDWHVPRAHEQMQGRVRQ